ncbi:hypothetical protein Tco_1194523 [Tanacetum coccineum]
MDDLKSYNLDAYDSLFNIPANKWSILHFSGSQYNVEQNGGSKYQVKGPCDCNTQHTKNGMGVGILENWVHATYRLETWAHVYSFKINPCNGREMWLVVESTTVIIPPNHKPQVGRPPKKRKKGCRGQGGASQAGGSSQAVGSRNASS